MIAICKVKYYDDFNDETKTEYITFTVANENCFVEAAQIINDYYGKDLISMSIQINDTPVLFLQESTYNDLINDKEGDYKC
jgi:hypothetical protein